MASHGLKGASAKKSEIIETVCSASLIEHSFSNAPNISF